MSDETETSSDEVPQVPDGDGKSHSDDASGTENETEQGMISLHTGRALTTQGASELTRAKDTHFIVLAGAVGSGKTTLLASIYECFQEGPFAGYSFAGSRTLLGLERRCHLARIESEMDRPNTQRTKIEEDYRLLHLNVSNPDVSQTSHDLLFTDLSGEIFRGMRDSTEECQRHRIFSRADWFVLLVDGDKLCSRFTRDRAITDAVCLLRRCIDAGTLGEHSYVDILFAKADLFIKGEAYVSEVCRFIRRMRDAKFKKPFRDQLARLRFRCVAARPEPAQESGLKRASGVASLFRSWVEEAPLSRGHCTGVTTPWPVREIERYRVYHSCEG